MARARAARRRGAPAPPAGGRRVARLTARRQRRARRWTAVTAVAVVALAVAATATLLQVGAPGPATAPRGGLEAVTVPTQHSLLLVRHDGDQRPATAVTLLAAGPGGVPAHVLFLPVGTLVDIPGVGLDRLGNAYQYGGTELLVASVENALGIAVDHAAAVDDAAFAGFLERAGPVQVEVPARLARHGEDGATDVRFQPGLQMLTGGRLAEYWSLRQDGEPELEVFPRRQRVLEAVLAAGARDPAVREALVQGAGQLGADAEDAWVGDLLGRLVDAQAAGTLRFVVLPVEPFGGAGPEGDGTYRLREAEARELVASTVAAGVRSGEADRSVRVQVLNGVGVPGLGAQVDRHLDEGFVTVLSGNVPAFGVGETVIVVYDESARSMEAARRVQELLGVGRIEASRQPQSVVDLTIVVGEDFVAARAGGGSPGGP